MGDRVTIIEFYNGPKGGLVASVKSHAVPRAGEYISIRGETWQVSCVTWALDHADDAIGKALRANVELVRTTSPGKIEAGEDGAR